MKDPRAKDIFQLGQLLNNTYRVEAVLGRGGLSEVYLARSTISGRVVAIKALRAVFADNESYTSLLTREEGVREIRHDAVVRYFDTQRTPDGIVYLVMDYIEGKALDIVLREGGMSMEDVLAVGERVLAGLADAHRNNIVHRDIAPDNIILRAGDPRQAVIIDFGIAKDTTPDAVTIVGEGFAGKLGYAAPEQFGGHTDPRSDIYALGAALLATYLGKKPNMGKQPMEVLPKKMQPLDTEGVPEPLRMLILRMTEPDAKKRFQTADEAVALFHRFRRLEEAGAFAVEVELAPAALMAEISARTGLVTVSLGSGPAADVMFLFTSDICGESDRLPRHARRYADIASLQKRIEDERIAGLSAFRRDIRERSFPSNDETARIDDAVLDEFRARIDD